MATNDEWVSLREFAKRKGVNPNAVTSAINNGRITRRDEDKKIHWPSQSAAWDRGRDQSKVRKEEDPEERDEPEGEEGEEGGRGEYYRAKVRKEVALAGLKELELQKERGEVVKASYVQNAMAQIAIDVRDSIMAIPDRVAAELAADLGLDEEVARAVIHKVWRRESRRALERIGKVIHDGNGG